MKQGFFFALVFMIVCILACSKDSDSSIPVTSSNINVFIAVPDLSFDVVVDTTSIGTEVGYGEATGYHAFQAKRYQLSIYEAGNHTFPLLSGQISLRNAHYYSIFLSKNHNNELQALLLEDELKKPAAAKSGRVRVVNLSDTYYTASRALTLDFYVDSVKRYQRMSYQAASSFLDIAAGTRLRDVRWADSSLSLLYNNAGSFTVEDQKNYTMVAYSNALVADSFTIATFIHEK